MVMGCYGIGVSRIVAAAIEQNHDADGIIFPLPLAPFQVILAPLAVNDAAVLAATEQAYADLTAAGLEVLLDDRDERPGVKFKDADLLGIPYRVVLGPKTLAQNQAEVRDRRSKQMELVPLPELSRRLAEKIQAGLAG
jgi:prolyl-tRNA synthetase